MLKTLETRKLVRPVKSHAAKNKKMYILYDLDASKEITGGAFYSGQDFDHELIQQLQQHALSFIAKEEGANVQKVAPRPDSLARLCEILVDGFAGAR